MIETMQGDTGPVQGTIGIVVSRYNDSITGKLLQGAIDTLRGAGLGEEDIVVAWVSGAWELPVVTDALFHERNCEGVIALGAVIRGETTHDQHINRAVSQGLMEISLRRGKPVGFGLLTVNNLEQAIHRAGGNVGNKGEEAALAVLDTLRILQRLSPTKKIGLQ